MNADINAQTTQNNTPNNDIISVNTRIGNRLIAYNNSKIIKIDAGMNASFEVLRSCALYILKLNNVRLTVNAVIVRCAIDGTDKN
jgi:hypothetical protein